MNIRTIVFITLVIGMLGAFHSTANAECAADTNGTVYCSNYATGGAVINSLGIVECGKGECQRNSIGSVTCSRVEGGGAAVNSSGTVKCLGGCEDGSQSMCVLGE